MDARVDDFSSMIQLSLPFGFLFELPLIFLYEMSVGLSRLIYRKKSGEEAESSIPV
ncbi:hypothetical protein [Aneurinibacillus tyrosinisolvens]|uniref:hypothetical protein n=1 Tax=Aneurinibacillus tyrosinisolvens TaxID=1443435 RepID=UPI000AADACDD|nr:hypothetical protein [Aneurinibacillus tyrosinisolvens]